jgi:hypothetical protein
MNLEYQQQIVSTVNVCVKLFTSLYNEQDDAYERHLNRAAHIPGFFESLERTGQMAKFKKNAVRSEGTNLVVEDNADDARAYEQKIRDLFTRKLSTDPVTHEERKKKIFNRYAAERHEVMQTIADFAQAIDSNIALYNAGYKLRGLVTS